MVVFLAPYVIVRLAIMAGNWGQHAFVDADDPANPFKNATTVINCRYNRRCFNDGYHVGHHIKPTRHWTEMPQDFEDNQEQYAKEGALVFSGIDFLMVWALLMFKCYDVLARHYVQLGETQLTTGEIISLMKTRIRPIVV